MSAPTMIAAITSIRTTPAMRRWPSWSIWTCWSNRLNESDPFRRAASIARMHRSGIRSGHVEAVKADLQSNPSVKFDHAFAAGLDIEARCLAAILIK